MKETAYQQTVQTAEKHRQERNKVRNRAQDQLVNNIVLQSERTNSEELGTPETKINSRESREKLCWREENNQKRGPLRHQLQ